MKSTLVAALLLGTVLPGCSGGEEEAAPAAAPPAIVAKPKPKPKPEPAPEPPKEFAGELTSLIPASLACAVGSKVAGLPELSEKTQIDFAAELRPALLAVAMAGIPLEEVEEFWVGSNPQTGDNALCVKMLKLYDRHKFRQVFRMGDLLTKIDNTELYAAPSLGSVENAVAFVDPRIFMMGRRTTLEAALNASEDGPFQQSLKAADISNAAYWSAAGPQAYLQQAAFHGFAGFSDQAANLTPPVSFAMAFPVTSIKGKAAADAKPAPVKKRRSNRGDDEEDLAEMARFHGIGAQSQPRVVAQNSGSMGLRLAFVYADEADAARMEPVIRQVLDGMPDKLKEAALYDVSRLGGGAANGNRGGVGATAPGGGQAQPRRGKARRELPRSPVTIPLSDVFRSEAGDAETAGDWTTVFAQRRQRPQRGTIQFSGRRGDDDDDDDRTRRAGGRVLNGGRRGDDEDEGRRGIGFGRRGDDDDDRPRRAGGRVIGGSRRGDDDDDDRGRGGISFGRRDDDDDDDRRRGRIPNTGSAAPGAPEKISFPTTVIRFSYELTREENRLVAKVSTDLPKSLVSIAAATQQALGITLRGDGVIPGTFTALTLGAAAWQGQQGGGPRRGVRMVKDKPVVAGYSWMTDLLPFLGHGEIHARFDFEKSWVDDANNRMTATAVIPQFLNPAAADVKWQGYPFSGLGLTHFAGMAGVEDGNNVVAAMLPRDDPRAGIFGYDEVAQPQDITDGAGNTIMMIGVGRLAGPWVQGGGATIRGAREPYFDELSGFRTAGTASGGTMVLFADGSSREISPDIDPAVFRAMCTTHGAEQVDLPKGEPSGGGFTVPAQPPISQPPIGQPPTGEPQEKNPLQRFFNKFKPSGK